MTVHGSTPMSMRPFKKHMKSLQDDYNQGQIYCMNLVDENKGFEPKLMNRYNELIKDGQIPEKEVSYHYFNWHKECHHGTQPYYKLCEDMIFPEHLKKAGIFVKEAEITVDCAQYPAKQYVHKKIVSRQTGAVRTNCIDCLDRTNVAQKVVCETVMKKFVLP